MFGTVGQTVTKKKRQRMNLTYKERFLSVLAQLGFSAANPHERRRYYNQLWSIVKDGQTEPVELFLVVLFLLTGGTLVFAGYHRAVDPQLFGTLYIVIGVMGLVGLVSRNLPLRVVFGLTGACFRFWLFVFYLSNNWREATWTVPLVGAIVFGWVAYRNQKLHATKVALKRVERAKYLKACGLEKHREG